MSLEKRATAVHSSEVTGDFGENSFNGGVKPKPTSAVCCGSAGCTDEKAINLNLSHTVPTGHIKCS